MEDIVKADYPEVHKVKSILSIMRLQKFTITVLSLIFFVSSANAQSPEENKKIIMRYLLDIINNRKLELLGEVFPEKFVRHDLNDSTDTWQTVADQHKRLSDLFHAFPDFKYSISDMIAEGDKVVVRAVWHGTQKNTFMNTESSSNHIHYLSEIIFYRVEKGKIVERWTQLDLHSLFKKMKEPHPPSPSP